MRDGTWQHAAFPAPAVAAQRLKKQFLPHFFGMSQCNRFNRCCPGTSRYAIRRNADPPSGRNVRHDRKKSPFFRKSHAFPKKRSAAHAADAPKPVCKHSFLKITAPHPQKKLSPSAPSPHGDPSVRTAPGMQTQNSRQARPRKEERASRRNPHQIRRNTYYYSTSGTVFQPFFRDFINCL